MLNAIEDIFMVNPINDTAKLKSLDSDSRLKAQQKETKGTENTSFLDSVSFSNTSKQLDALKASLRDIPEINEARVAYFKAEIESGNYEIHSDKIARNMFNLEMA